MQTTGNLIVDGVVQIVVAHVGNNSVESDKIPDLMKSVSQTLIECIQDASRALGGQVSTPSAPRLASPAPRLAAPAPGAAAEPAAPVNAVIPETTSQESTRDSASAYEPAPSSVPEPVAAQPSRRTDLPTKPAVPIAQSIRPDAIVCLFDGEPRKMLHRHIRAKYNMSPEEYRAYWNLPDDYPMTAPGYSEEKRIVAVAQGLGTHKSQTGRKGKQTETARKRVRQTT